MEFEDECIEEEVEQDVSTQFLQTRRNQFFNLQDLLEKKCNVFSSPWLHQRKIRH